MTDISVQSTSHQVEKRSWYLGTADYPGLTVSGTLDISEFDSEDNYPNGYIPSGTPVSFDASSGLWAPYVNDSGDFETCDGLLFSSVKVPNLADTTVNVGAAILHGLCMIDPAKLPVELDDEGLADLKARGILTPFVAD